MRQALCPFYKLTDQGQLTKAELISKGYQSNKCKVKFNVLSIVLESYSANDWNEVHKKSVSLLWVHVSEKKENKILRLKKIIFSELVYTSVQLSSVA